MPQEDELRSDIHVHRVGHLLGHGRPGEHGFTDGLNAALKRAHSLRHLQYELDRLIRAEGLFQFYLGGRLGKVRELTLYLAQHINHALEPA